MKGVTRATMLETDRGGRSVRQLRIPPDAAVVPGVVVRNMDGRYSAFSVTMDASRRPVLRLSAVYGPPGSYTMYSVCATPDMDVMTIGDDGIIYRPLLTVVPCKDLVVCRCLTEFHGQSVMREHARPVPLHVDKYMSANRLCAAVVFGMVRAYASMVAAIRVDSPRHTFFAGGIALRGVGV